MTRDHEDQDARVSRRELLASGAVAVAGGATLLGAARAADAAEQRSLATSRGGGAPGTVAAEPRALPPGKPGRDYTPVIVPNGAKLPWKVVDGVKVFHLIAEEVDHELVPGLKV